MVWVTRKYKNYLLPLLQYLNNLFKYLATSKNANTCILLADFAEYGGTRTYFEQLCQYLKEKDQVVICLIANKQKNAAFLDLINIYGFKFELIPDKEYIIDYTGKWSLKLYFYFLNKLLSDFNLFIAFCRKYKTSTFLISTGEPEKWLYLLWLPVNNILYILHTLPSKNIGSIGGFTLQKRLSLRKRIITVSNFSQKKLLHYWNLYGFHEQYVKVIHNFFEPSSNSFSKDADDAIIILTLGHVVSYKDPKTWIDVAKLVLANLPNKKIEFVWAGDGLLFNECQNEVFDNPFIKFSGYIKNVTELYSSADIYFQPSLVESHGIAVIGAMYHELPCVVSKVGGLTESVVDNVNGYLIKPRDTRGFSKKIELLVNDVDKRKAMGQSSKMLFNEKFSRAQWLKNMNELIKI
ncbi:MAG TPA: glycosyltransferase family 4 protein [Flavisolibacter sp.]|nr:glycosyltransferase family 4 protein [Flavisolibacter sp.]